MLTCPAVALLFSCFWWLPPSRAQGELVQGGSLLESPTMDQINSWVCKTLQQQQCEKPILLSLRHFSSWVG